MDRKQEALDRIAAAKREIEEAEKIIEAEGRRDTREEYAWINHWGFVSNNHPDAERSIMVAQLKVFSPNEAKAFITTMGAFRFFRLATAKELGFSPSVSPGIQPDWSKAPEWAMSGAFDGDGAWIWMEERSPAPGFESGWNDCGRCKFVACGDFCSAISSVINWRTSLCKRPEAKHE